MNFDLKEQAGIGLNGRFRADRAQGFGFASVVWRPEHGLGFRV